MAAYDGNTVYGTTPDVATHVPGWREPSLMGKIITISPEDYVVFSHTGNTRARDVRHFWQRRLLPSRDGAAQDRDVDVSAI